MDVSTYQEAIAITEKFLGAGGGGAALHHLRAGAAGQREETPKGERPGDVQVLLAGQGALGQAAATLARNAGTAVHRFALPLQGDVNQLAARILQEADSAGLWIGYGEATIALPPSPGIGGRAQHLALLLANGIAGRRDIRALVVGTDGIDGNSGAAGAIVDGDTWNQLSRVGIDGALTLQNRDSATALAAAGAQVVLGATGVNHADLILVQIS